MTLADTPVETGTESSDLKWLDLQPSCSVLYISLCSFLSDSGEHVNEMVMGLKYKWHQLPMGCPWQSPRVERARRGAWNGGALVWPAKSLVPFFCWGILDALMLEFNYGRSVCRGSTLWSGIRDDWKIGWCRNRWSYIRMRASKGENGLQSSRCSAGWL